MSIININSFESRVSNANYLSNYTDPYLKQSLANLGQRLSTKRDSIKNDSFIISDLFPNYLGDFNQSNIAAEFTWTKSSNSIVGKIVEVDAEETSDKSGTRVPVGYDETNSNINGNANSQFTIESSNNILKNITKDQAAKIMPRSLNPNKGFIGSPYKKFPLGFWVAPNGVKPVVKHYLGTATNMTGCSIAAIKKKLIRSHLVVAWVGWFDGFSNHAIALTGYHGNTLYYNDPWTGTKRSMSVATFQRHWALDGHRALSY